MPSFSLTTVEQSFAASLIKTRDAGSHKGNHGHALLIAGEQGKMGAAVIAASACLRTGAGLTTVNVPAGERQVLQVAVPEAMLMMREETIIPAGFSAIGIGPGAGVNAAMAALLEKIIAGSRVPLLLDADALNILSGQKKLWPLLPAGTVLTPHPGEFDRLFGSHDSLAARNAKAVELSLLYPWVIVLKGAATHVLCNGKAWVNTTGNAGLAKGGSGDALTGMILSLLAQGYEPLHAAILGVYLHGLAADFALNGQSLESLLISDIFNYIGKAFNATRMAGV